MAFVATVTVAGETVGAVAIIAASGAAYLITIGFLTGTPSRGALVTFRLTAGTGKQGAAGAVTGAFLGAPAETGVAILDRTGAALGPTTRAAVEDIFSAAAVVKVTVSR